MSAPDEQPLTADADQVDAPTLDSGTDVVADPQDLETDEAMPTSTAEGFREDGDTQGGTGGLDAGGAG